MSLGRVYSGQRGVMRHGGRGSCAHPDADERPDSHEVVRGVREGEDPTHFLAATMMQFAQPADRLPPAKAFFDELPFDLTDLVARVARGAPIDGTLGSRLMDVLRDMRRGVALTHAGDEVREVIALIRPHGAAAHAGLERRQHLDGSVPCTVKCSCNNSPRCSAALRTSCRNPSAMWPFSRRSRFFVNTVGAHTGSSGLRPTNQRNSRL